MSKTKQGKHNMGRQSNTTEYHLILSGKKRQTSVNLLDSSIFENLAEVVVFNKED